jgi:hypothetical protein
VTFTDELALNGNVPSIGSIGDAYDGALLDSLNGLYNSECAHTTVFHDGPHNTTPEVEIATAGSIDWYKNPTLHSSLGHAPPNESKQALYATPNRTRQPA